MKKPLSLLFALAALTSYGQNPAPAKPQTKPIALTGGTVHIGNGQVIPNGVVLFDKGVITNVIDGTTARLDFNGVEVIDVSGKHVYPGFISPSSTVGLQEISAVRATVDMRETGALNPNVRALIAYNTDSEIIPTIRNNGVLFSQATPQGGTISGSSSVMMSDGWNWEDAVLKKDDGIWLTWPAYFARDFNMEDFSLVVRRNERREAAISTLQATFADARAYAALSNPTPMNLKLESMKGLFTGKQNLYIRADNGKDIIESVKFAKGAGVQKVVIVGGEDASRAITFLKENNVPVILGELHRLPAREDEDVDLPYRLPGILQKAGILVGLSYSDGWWRTRNLAFQAGTAAGFGVTEKEEALKMVTSNTAKILGIDSMVGTLEKGKHATLFVSAGDALDMRTNVVEKVFIQGKKVDLDDRHKRLYRTYKDKYEQK
ncbi:amidohydrolase [Spirosoma harenae]